MTEDHAIIDQANKLMRKRVFVASGALPPSPPPAPEPAPAGAAAVIDIDDVPLLTEIFSPPEAPAAAAEAPEPVIPQDLIDARAAELAQAQLPFQRQAMADEVAAWLDNELPQVVVRVLDGLTDQIIGRVTEEAKAVLVPRLQDALEADNIPLDDEG